VDTNEVGINIIIITLKHIDVFLKHDATFIIANKLAVFLTEFTLRIFK
jgi:hypothetical protein